MKIRKQVQKQAEEAALLEPGEDKKKNKRGFARQEVAMESTETGGRLMLGKSMFGDCRTRGGAHTSSEGGAHLQLEVHVAAPPVDQTTTTTTALHEAREESNSGSCGDWTRHLDDHNNAKRKYARRSLRSGTLVVQSGSKVILRRSNNIPSRGDGKTGHPSEEPEGSLLHCLYLQLLAAGSEGMTLKEIFASFASQTRFSTLGSHWREQVKLHLQAGNPHFTAVKARHFLSEQLQPSPPPPPPPPQKAASRSLVDLNIAPLSRASRRSAKSSTHCDTSDPLSPSPDPSVVYDDREGVQTRRKTYERTIEAVLNESAVEFQKTQKLEEIGDTRSTDELSTASRRSSDVGAVLTPLESAINIEGVRPTKKRKSPAMDNIFEPVDFRHTGAVPGSLKAMQARIVAETGVHSGVRCSRKDGSNHHSKWQCPMMAMEGRSLCQHHNFLSERKKARYKKAKRQAAAVRKSPANSSELRPDQGSSRKSIPVVVQLQDLNQPPRSDSEDEAEDEDEVSDPPSTAHRLVRTRSDANGSLAESANNVHTTEDMDSETEGGQLVPRSRSGSLKPPAADHHQPGGRQSCRSTRKPRLYLAAKKTAEKTPVVAAALGKSVKKQSVPLIRPPSIPPLPMLYGVRRKAMKTRPPQ